MAVDYLFAYYLLEGNLGNIQQMCAMLREAGYINLPRHIAEAAVLYGVMTQQKMPAEIAGYPINREVQQDFIDFNMIMRQNQQDKKKMKRELAKKYAATYWYYVRYISPRVTGLELQSKEKQAGLYELF